MTVAVETDVDTLCQLACLRFRQGALAESASLFEQALEADPRHVASWLNLGSAFVASRQLIEAEECFQRVTQIDADNTDGWLNLANVRKVAHRVNEAAAAFQQAARRLPPQPLIALWPATLCPAVFQSNQQIDAYRTRLRDELAQRRQHPIVFDPELIGALASPPPLNLQYQGRNDRPLLEAFAALFPQPDNAEGSKVRRTSRRPSIGFVVTGGHEAIFGRFLGGLLNRLSTKSSDLTVICPQTGLAELHRSVTNAALRWLPLPYRLADAADTIGQAGFDVLYHWETGTDVANYFLPFCRLAPVQCTSLGNSQTSGIPHIDYFLSSRLYEPQAADEHYSETLLLLDGLGSYQNRVAPPSRLKSREAFGCSSRQRLYVCAQKPQKIHPDFDPLLAGILRQDERGIVVLVEDQQRTAGELLRRRFQSSMPDVAHRVCFAPHMEFADYLSLLAAADVLLDPPHYGGGLTLYDALSLDRPVVTLPGEFARGRYAWGAYQQMELTELVAAGPDDYVNIAVRLATDPDYRHHVEAKLRERTPLIFEEARVVAEYERVLEQLVAAARANSSM